MHFKGAYYIIIAGTFRKNKSCIDNVYTLNEVVQGRLREDAFFLDVQKAYDTVWTDGLWLKLWDWVLRGRCGV